METIQAKNIEELREENQELKRTLSICLNQPLIKRLKESMQRIEEGEYLTEEEFFRDSPQIIV